ncbi:MAG: DUF296 domain-containing protein [Bradymonadales bacterium]|jgi:predicted DNA-binding protein with PD1-like motif
MKYGASIRSRHIVAKFDRGEEFTETMLRLCAREKIKAAVFTGVGSLCSADLQSYNEQNQRYETSFKSETCMSVPTLTGSVSVLGSQLIIDAQCILRYSVFGQTHLISGHILKARVHCLELHITMFDDLIIERSFDMATGLAPWGKIQSTIEDEYSDSALAFAYISSSERLDELLSSDDNSVGRKEPKVLRRNIRPSDDNSSVKDISAACQDATQLQSTLSHDASPAMTEEDFNASTRGEWLKAKRRLAASKASNDSSIGVLRSSDLQSAVPMASGQSKVYPSLGDRLEHPSYGECSLLSIADGGGATVKIIENDEVKSINLKDFSIKFVDKGDSSRFKLTEL